MTYTPFIDFRNRLLSGHPISTIEGPDFDTPEEAYDYMEKLVEIIQPMNGEYSITLVEHI